MGILYRITQNSENSGKCRRVNGVQPIQKNVILLEVAFETLINSKNELLGDIMSRDNFYPLIALYQKIQFFEGFPYNV